MWTKQSRKIVKNENGKYQAPQQVEITEEKLLPKPKRGKLPATIIKVENQGRTVSELYDEFCVPQDPRNVRLLNEQWCIVSIPFGLLAHEMYLVHSSFSTKKDRALYKKPSCWHPGLSLLKPLAIRHCEARPLRRSLSSRPSYSTFE